mmetsp:Transcript_17820/g.30114  ORF Transcript_17820/g.30114 Transcript_17820/m.30114 type:complete len:86 (-) Transcript_17820:1369-1626(-)
MMIDEATRPIPGKMRRFNKFRIDINPITVTKRSPIALPPVPTSVSNNPALNVPLAIFEGTTLLIIDAVKDSHTSTPIKAIRLPVT